MNDMAIMRMDQRMSVAELRQQIKAFREARGWNNTDNAKNLAMALTVEAVELMEIFSWCNSDNALECGKKEFVHLHEEISDVLIYLLSIADLFDVDLCSAVEDKLTKNARKYPESYKR